MEKKCHICNSIKNISEFYKNQTRCKLCTKQYAIDNKKRIHAYKKEYRINNIELIKESDKKYYESNKESLNKRNMEYYYENRDRLLKSQEEYRCKNKELVKERNKEYSKKYYDKNIPDVVYKISGKMRNSLYLAFKNSGFTKSYRTEEIIGCSFEELKSYLESKFEPWMNWDNHGKNNGLELNFGWDIDHIIPLSSAKTEEELIKMNHYTNLQPLCSYINRNVKKNRLDFVGSLLLNS